MGQGKQFFCIKTVRIYAKNAKNTPMLLFAGLRNKRQVLLIRIHDLCRLFKSYNKNDFKLGSMAVSNNFNFFYHNITKLRKIFKILGGKSPIGPNLPPPKSAANHWGCNCPLVSCLLIGSRLCSKLGPPLFEGVKIAAVLVLNASQLESRRENFFFRSSCFRGVNDGAGFAGVFILGFNLFKLFSFPGVSLLIVLDALLTFLGVLRVVSQLYVNVFFTLFLPWLSSSLLQLLSSSLPAASSNFFLSIFIFLCLDDGCTPRSITSISPSSFCSVLPTSHHVFPCLVVLGWV